MILLAEKKHADRITNLRWVMGQGIKPQVVRRARL